MIDQITYENGDIYVGDILNEKPHGTGEFLLYVKNYL